MLAVYTFNLEVPFKKHWVFRECSCFLNFEMSFTRQVLQCLGNSSARHFGTSTSLFRVHKPSLKLWLRNHAEEHDDKWSTDMGTWTDRNNIVYPPLKDGSRRPVEIYCGREALRYSPKKMLPITRMIRNKNIDQAISLLEHLTNKGATMIRDILVEAQEYAVNEQNVEFKSNLHIVRSFVERSHAIRMPIFHAKGRVGKGTCYFSNYYVMLREGQCEEYIPRVTAEDMAISYLSKLKRRTIRDGL